MRKPGPDILLILGVFVFAVFGLPGVALAWGPSVHLWIGDTLIQTAAAALPLVAALIRRHARSFLYGTIAPDFFVGKGCEYHEEHCHNWSTGRRLLAAAEDDHERAFALGYATHLAADVVGHNYFVPNNLYRTVAPSRLGHVYFELHADNILDREQVYPGLAASLVRESQRQADMLLTAVVAERGLFAFGTKKRIFTSYVSLSNSGRFKRVLTSVRRYSESVLRHDDVRDMIDLSLACAWESLKDPDVPVIGRYDPIGAANIRLARELRRSSKRAGSYRPSDVPFPIPAELRALRARLAELGPARPVLARPASVPAERAVAAV